MSVNIYDEMKQTDDISTLRAKRNIADHRAKAADYLAKQVTTVATSLIIAELVAYFKLPSKSGLITNLPYLLAGAIVAILLLGRLALNQATKFNHWVEAYDRRIAEIEKAVPPKFVNKYWYQDK